MRLAEQCPGCGSPDFVVSDVGVIAPFVAYRTGIDPAFGKCCACRRCGLRFSRVRFDDDEAGRLYADYRGSSYNEDRERFEAGYTERFAHLNDKRDSIPFIEEWVERVIGVPCRVLDIGGNDGGNTPFAGRAEVVIVEVGDRIPDERFDLVVLAHVLEHVSDPGGLVDRALSLGPVYAEVPVEDYSMHWHEHVQIFDRESFAAVLKHRAVEITSMDTNVGPVLMGLAA